MDLDAIQTHNEQQAQNAEERAKIEDTAFALSKILDSQKGIEDSVKESILRLVQFIAKNQPKVSVTNQQPFPKFDEIVSAVKEVVEAVKDSKTTLEAVEQKEADFTPITKSLEKLSQLVAKLPTVIPVAKPVEQKDYTGKFDEVTQAVGKIPAPIVNVEKTVIPDNSKELEKLLKAVEKIKFPDIPKTDLKPLIEATQKVSKTIASLSFPVPNYVLPFKNVQGAASQVQLDSSGNVPVSGTVTATPTGTQNVDVTANTVGLATSAKQDTLLTELQLKADLTETQPVSLASVPSHAVTNAGTFAVQNTAATPAGTNNIGDVDVLTMPAITGTVTSNAGTGTFVTSDSATTSLDGKTPDLSGTWGYNSGTSGTLTLTGSKRVLQITAIAQQAAASLTINAGNTITLPYGSTDKASSTITIEPKGNLTDPTIVFTGTVGFFVEYVT